jgi:hypothetical protein
MGLCLFVVAQHLRNTCLRVQKTQWFALKETTRFMRRRQTMSQQPNDAGRGGAVAVYDDNTRTGGGGGMPVRNERNVDLNVVTPTDRVRSALFSCSLLPTHMLYR